MSLENASDEVKLAVDLIMLLESHQIPAQTVLSALEIVRRDYANKLKTRKAGRKTQRSRMLSPAVCWQSGPLRMTPLETILMEKSVKPHTTRCFARCSCIRRSRRIFAVVPPRAVSGDLRTGFAAAGLR